MNREVRIRGEAQVYLLKHSRDSGKFNPLFRLFSTFLLNKHPRPGSFACVNVNKAAKRRQTHPLSQCRAYAPAQEANASTVAVQEGEGQRARTRYTAAAH